MTGVNFLVVCAWSLGVWGLGGMASCCFGACEVGAPRCMFHQVLGGLRNKMKMYVRVYEYVREYMYICECICTFACLFK